MARLLVFGWLGLWTSVLSYGQAVDCRTIGFDDGSFQGWERWTAEMSPYVFPVTLHLEPGSLHSANGEYGHIITSRSDGYDPNVREPIPVVAPGSQYSVRIGDLEAGGYVDQLRTTFVVPADKPLLRYQVAVVLQNPNHRIEHQPGFSLLIRTLAGDTVRCGYYEAVATNQTAGFIYQEKDSTFDRLLYRNWTSHVLDLRAYVGQTLRLEVTTHDCTEGGHYGYAYFDAQCLEMAITASSGCTPQASLMRLTAPAGFDRYRWNTGDTTATIQITPKLRDTYWVDVESRSTLNPTCQTTLRLNYQVDQLMIPTVQQVSLCAGETYSVGDSIYTRSDIYRHVFPRSSGCDSILITNLTIRPAVNYTQSITLCQGSQLVVGDSTYSTTGSYLTRIARHAPLCDSLVTTHLVIRQATIKPLRDTVMIQGDSLQLIASGPSDALYSWSPSTDLSCPGCAITWAKPTQTTHYQVKVRLANTDCEASYGMNVEVLPCLLAMPSSFTPNGDGVNDTFRAIVNPCLGRLRQLTIYNRWGQVIFHQVLTSLFDQVLAWDGSYHGETTATGVYSYQLTIESGTGKISTHTGALTLIR
ncbi:T9SS type B sorting domain-containing protein [Spirosoma jeollabukense]